MKKSWLHARSKIWLLPLLALVIGLAVAGSTHSSASAATCATPTYHFYPGKAISHIRYGDATVTINACTDISTSGWSLNVPDKHENGTAKLLGFDINFAYPTTLGTGRTYRTWDVHIGLRECVVYKVAFCDQEAEWKVTFSAYRSGSHIIIRNPPIIKTVTNKAFYQLFTTP